MSSPDWTTSEYPSAQHDGTSVPARPNSTGGIAMNLVRQIATSRSSALIATLLALMFTFLLALSPPAQAQLKSGDNPDGNEVWQKLRTSLFEKRPITKVGDELVELNTPTRAEDAAIVPIAIKLHGAAAQPNQVRKLYLLIDNNPSPIAAVFTYSALSGRADIETRVRVDEYTHVRAIADMSDGRLLMATKFVKASGGCSAPPGKDQQAAMASLGKMKFRVEGDVAARKPVLAQLMISHPNNSGLAMDQFTRQFTPSHYVRTVNVSYGGQEVLSADVDISISENPSFRFYFVPTGEGELRAEVTDSRDKSFQSALKVRPID
jgi:sulfur-oxidizing protein SoxY